MNAAGPADPSPGGIRLAGLPMPLRRPEPETSWQIVTDPASGTETLRIESGPRTDLILSPAGDGADMLNAPRLLAETDGDFLFSARVAAGFGADFDAAALLVWFDEDRWAKLCFEFSPQRRPMVVSVVTVGRSDDANCFEVEDDHVFLRVARLGEAYAFHASRDGGSWSLVRHFGLGTGAAPLLGFASQSPRGPGCTATFSDIAFSRRRLGALRDGT